MSASVPHQAAGRARGEQTRRQLLAAATELFGEYGLEGATTRDIAQRITYYFSSKEGLYLAVAQPLADFIQQAFAPLVAEVDRFRQEPAAQRSSDAALRLLQRGLLAFSELMTQPHTLNLSKIMSREQLAPTEAYPLIHSQVIAPMHERLCRLLSAATGIDEHAPRLVLHTHALIGEVLSFRVARETIRRQAGWQDIGEGEAAQIAAVLSEHIEILVTGLRQRHGA